MKRKIFTTILLFFIGMTSISLFDTKNTTIIDSPAERMYSSLICYADSFNIPLYIAFNIATIETGYRGPLDINYNHSQASKAGALGPMQIMHKYSHYYAGRKVTRQELRDSIEFNVKLSMIILSSHYEKYKDWGKVAGAYNTGKPVINSYAKRAVDSTYFQKKWIISTN
jgi:soluble lytic murein transglycosylase-like protein